MSSITDLLTASKNIASAINQLGQTFLKVQGVSRSNTLTTTTATLISTGQGRVASVSVIASSGSVDGMIYDSNSASTLTNALALIDHTVGVKVLNLPYYNGLVIVPGSGMTVVVTYSEG